MPLILTQESQSTSPRDSGGARRAALGSGCGSQDHRDGGRWSLAQEVGRDRQPGARQGAGGPPCARALSRICSCPFPGGEGDRHLPCREGGAWGSWSLTRPPAAWGAANFRTVVTLKRGPSHPLPSVPLSPFPLSPSVPPSPSLSLPLSPPSL